MKSTVLIWLGLAVVWIGAGVLTWGVGADASGSTLLEVGSLAAGTDVSHLALDDPRRYLAGGALFALTMVTILAPFLAVKAAFPRIVLGIAYLIAGAVFAWRAHEAATEAGTTLFDDPGQGGTALFFAVPLLVLGVDFLLNQSWTMAGIVGLMALAAAVWTVNTVINLPPVSVGDGLPGAGAIAVTLGYLAVAVGCGLVTRPPRRGRSTSR